MLLEASRLMRLSKNPKSIDRAAERRPTRKMLRRRKGLENAARPPVSPQRRVGVFLLS